MQTKFEIAAGIEETFEGLAQTLETQAESAWSASADGKWSPGQQADHLVRSAKPVNLAMRLPGFVLALMFGKARRPSSSFEEVRERYRGVLAQGAKASGQYVPAAPPVEKKAATIAALRREKARLIDAVRARDERFLDSYVVPHPLIGKMTLREILWFTVYHTSHHAESIRASGGK